MDKILNVENLTYKVEDKKTLFKKINHKTILQDVSFSINRGNIVGITGESGGGKTTLIKIIAGIIKNYEGNISYNLNDKKRNTNISPVQILFQNNGQIINPHRIIEDTIEEALLLRKVPKENLQIEKDKIFNSVNFNKNLLQKRGNELSGGEQQRAMLARILAVNPEIILLDEPFSAQDFESELNLVQLFKQINKEFGITLICISHDIRILRDLTNNVLIMYKGKIIEQGITSKVLTNPQNPYTQYLLKSENLDLTYDELKLKIYNPVVLK